MMPKWRRGTVRVKGKGEIGSWDSTLNFLRSMLGIFTLRTREIDPALRFSKPGRGKRRMAATSVIIFI
jgi:hypothetical protein